jgi:hypothetical protein
MAKIWSGGEQSPYLKDTPYGAPLEVEMGPLDDPAGTRDQRVVPDRATTEAPRFSGVAPVDGQYGGGQRPTGK